MRSEHPGILDGGVSLVIEKLYTESRIDGGLFGIGDGPVDLIQAEACEQSRLVGQLMIDANRKLICVGDDLRGSCISARSVWTLRDRWEADSEREAARSRR